MVRIKLTKDGRYYVERRVRAGYKQPNKKAVWRDWFFVKYHPYLYSDKGLFTIGRTNVGTPKELVGKRIRLVVEVVEDKK